MNQVDRLFDNIGDEQENIHAKDQALNGRQDQHEKPVERDMLLQPARPMFKPTASDAIKANSDVPTMIWITKRNTRA